MNLRIKYKKLIRSTNIEPSALLKNVIDELNKASYEITTQTESSVQFKNNIWGSGSRTDVYKKVDGGQFDINSKNSTLVLTYYISPLFEVLLSCVVAFFGFIKDYHFLVFIVIIAFAFFIKVMSQRMVVNRLMQNVLNPKLS